MNTKIAFVTLAALFSAPAAAADLTVNQCMTVYSGLVALRYSGAQLNDQRPAPADAKQYKFSGNTRWTLALDQASLKAIVDRFQRSYNELVTQIGDGKPITPGSPEWTKLNEEIQKIMDHPCEVHPDKVRRQDLDLDHNEIPGDVLAALTPIIDVLPQENK